VYKSELTTKQLQSLRDDIQQQPQSPAGDSLARLVEIVGTIARDASHTLPRIAALEEAR